MTTLTVRYTERDGYWVARCDELPELVAGDVELAEAMSLAHAAVSDICDSSEVSIDHVVEGSPSNQETGRALPR